MAMWSRWDFMSAQRMSVHLKRVFEERETQVRLNRENNINV